MLDPGYFDRAAAQAAFTHRSFHPGGRPQAKGKKGVHPQHAGQRASDPEVTVARRRHQPVKETVLQVDPPRLRSRGQQLQEIAHCNALNRRVGQH